MPATQRKQRATPPAAAIVRKRTARPRATAPAPAQRDAAPAVARAVEPVRVWLLDPNWQYEQGGRGAASNHYQTADLERIASSLPILEHSADAAAMFMWATAPMLPKAIELIRLWGFTYKTVAFTWVKLDRRGKPIYGLGHYTRANAEFCLLATRGNLRRRPTATDVPSVILAPDLEDESDGLAADLGGTLLARRRQHSRKPDEQYSLIERTIEGPYCEVHARQAWPNWRVIGDQSDLFAAQPLLMGAAGLEPASVA